MKILFRQSTFVLFIVLAQFSISAPTGITKLLPANNDIKGWTQKGKPRIFANEKLWEYMDGGADVYIDYGFTQVATVELQQGKNSVVSDIYEMKAVDGAFGIFGRESAPAYHFAPIGCDGYQEAVSLNFYQANYYVKLTAYSDNAATKDAMKKIAESISKKIGGAKTPPVMMKLFPQSGLVAHSGRYDVKDFLGRKELKEAYSAKVGYKGKTFTLFLCNAQSASNAAQRVKALKSSAANLANVEKEAAGLGDAVAAVRHSEAKELLAIAKGKYIVGVYPAGDGKIVKELLKEEMKRLK